MFDNCIKCKSPYDITTSAYCKKCNIEIYEFFNNICCEFYIGKYRITSNSSANTYFIGDDSNLFYIKNMGFISLYTTEQQIKTILTFS